MSAASAVSEALGDALGSAAARAARNFKPATGVSSTALRTSASQEQQQHQRRYQQVATPSLLGPQGRLPIAIPGASTGVQRSANGPTRARVGLRGTSPTSSASSIPVARANGSHQIDPRSAVQDPASHSSSSARRTRSSVVKIDIPPLLDSTLSEEARHPELSSSVDTAVPPASSPSPFRAVDSAGFRRRTSIHKPPNASSPRSGSQLQQHTSDPRSKGTTTAAAAAASKSPASALLSSTAAATYMASAFLRRKQPFLEPKASGTRHSHSSTSMSSTASPMDASAAPARVFFHDNAVSECESQDSRCQLSLSASSVSLPESSSTSAETAAAADTKELRPATRKDSTPTRPRRKPVTAASSGTTGDKRDGECIGELSRKEDEFDFAILLKPSKYEELLDLPHTRTEQLSPATTRRHHALDHASALSGLSSATTATAIGTAAGSSVYQISSGTTTSVRHLDTAMTTELVPSHAHLHGSAKHDPARARNLIIARIKQTGLQVKRLLSLDGKQTLLKVKAPAHVLELGAERLRLRKLRRFDCIWMEFSRELRTTFADFDARSDTVRFIDSEKQSIVHALLTSDDGGAGLNEFCALKTKYVVQMFPLHKQDLSSLKMHWVTYWRAATAALSPLSTSTASPDHSERGSCCSRLVCDVLTQPIDDVAQYFGEKVAFYFAWMEMYTRWLVVPSAVGLVLFCLQVSSKTIDHPLAPLYAIFMALWTSAFLVAWKRRAAALAYRWGTLGYEEDVEVTRPEFYGDPAISTPAHKRYPAWRRTLKYVVTLPTVLGSMALTLAITYIAFSTRDRLEHDSLAAKARAKHIAQDIAADLSHGLTLANLKRLSALGLDWRFWFYFLVTPMLYGLLIPVLDYVFTKGARAMTNWENHRTESRHRSHLILKVFSFRFVHVFASLYYYAFTDVSAVDSSASSSSDASTVSPLASAESPTLSTRSDNLLRVAIQLASFMVAGQLWKNVMETLIPFVRRRWRMQQKKRDTNAQFSQSSVFSATAMRSSTSTSSGGVGGARRRGIGAPAQVFRNRAPPGATAAMMSNTNALIHEQCVRLEQASDKAWEEAELEPYDTFEDYTEMLIQFGYVSFFSLAFPLAPLLALLNNVFELRTDAFKLCHAKQRPIAHKASGIGIWFYVLQLMSVLAVLTNCLHIAFTTSLLERLAPASAAASVTMQTKVWVAFGAEHALLMLKVAMMLAIPAMPRDVQNKVRLEREQAKQESARAMAAKMVVMHAAVAADDGNNEAQEDVEADSLDQVPHDGGGAKQQ